MRFVHFVLSALFLFSSVRLDVNAFTNGTLLPSYICGPPTDGLPKSLAGYLPYMVRATTAVATNPDLRIDYRNDDGSLLNTQLLLTDWHNRDVGGISGCNNTIFVTTSLVAKPSIVNQIVPGQLHTITLTENGHVIDAAAGTLTQCDFYTSAAQVTAEDIANIALDGAVVYAQDQNGVRVGSFTAFGPADATTMQPWAACGLNNVGIVHNQLISDAGAYTGITWMAPANLVPTSTLATSMITFKGAAVTDVGFGKHQSTFPIVTPQSVGVALPVAKPTITFVGQIGNQLIVFWIDPAKNAPAANAQVVPTSFLVQAKGTVTVQTTVNTAKQTWAWLPTTQIKGQTVSITVTASNTQLMATPTTSDPKSFAVAAANNQKNAVLVELCAGDVVAQRAQFNQDTDPDNQCAFQLDAVNNLNFTFGNATITTIITSGAQQSSPAFTLIGLLALAVALFAARK